MTPERKSELIALALGWSLKPAAGYVGGRAWFAPGSDVDQCWRPDYMTDDAAAIRDVLPGLQEMTQTGSVEFRAHPSFGWKCWERGAVSAFDEQGKTAAAVLCEAFAASQGGWDELEARYGSKDD